MIAFGLSIEMFAWIFLALSTIVVCSYLEEATFFLGLGTIVFLISGAIAFHLTSFAALLASPLTLGLILGGYLVVGAIWPWLAWASFLSRARERYDEAVEEWNERVVPPACIDGDSKRIDGIWVKRQRFISDRVGFTLPVKVKEHRGRIIRWMAYWPFSLLRTILNDPLRRFWNALYNLYARRMQAMADRMVPSS